MLHIESVIVVEGKYDKERLKKITDAPIICTNGFELYRSKRIIQSIKKMAENRGIIVLTDSDSAGFRIRNYIKGCLGGDYEVMHAYIPRIEGKEKRKEKCGAEGILGVEGMDEELLSEILKRTVMGAENQKNTALEPITKAEFFADGFSGKPDSAKKREELARKMELPPNMSAKALLELINKIYGRDEYKRVIEKIK